MHDARSLFIALFLTGSFAGASPATAAEHTSPPSATSHEVSVLRQVAAALAAGSKAIEDLRGPPIEHSNLDRLKLATPGMDCGMDRVLMFVACRSTSLKKQEAEALFNRMIDVGGAALPSDSWTLVEEVPHVGLFRSVRYRHRRSSAHIDLDLVVYSTWEAESLYAVRFFGWKAY